MGDRKPQARAMDLALRYLAVRPRSRREIADYLDKKEVPEDLARDTINTLEGYGYIDDRKFAAAYARYLIMHRGLSRYGVRAELLRKGVSREDAASGIEGLEGDDGPEDDEAVAIRVARKKAALLRGVDAEKARRRISDHLRRRGFSYDIIRKALNGLDEG